LCSRASSCWSRTELCQCGSLMCFLVGCALVAFGNEESVVRVLPPTNSLFLAGSALLLADTLLVAWSHRKRMSFNKVACCHDDDSDHCCIELVVAGSFVFAGILGGYGESQALIRVGMFGWALGSVMGLLETNPELYQRYSSKSCQCQSTPTPLKPEPSQASNV
jgi:hypothetical protein